MAQYIRYTHLRRGIHRPVIRRIALLVIVCAIVTHAFGRAGEEQTTRFRNDGEKWRWVHFDQSTGLPSNEVNSLVQTGDGTLFAGTGAGPVWFDGYTWHKIPVDSSDRNERFKLLWSCGNGTVIGKSSNQDIFLFDKSKILLLAKKADEAVPLKSGFLLRRGKALVMLLDGLETVLQNHPLLEPGDNDKLLWYTPAGAIWLSAIDGLYMWSGNAWQRRFATGNRHIDLSQLSDAPDNRILYFCFLPVPERGVRELTARGGSRLLMPGLFGSLIGSSRGSGLISFLVHNSVYVDSASYLPRGDEPFMPRWEFSAPVDGYKVASMLVSAAGDFWFGTPEGIYCYRFHSSRWTVPERKEAGSRNTLEIAQARDGKIWTGTEDGIEVFSGDRLVQSIREIAGSRLRDVTGVASDRSGNMLISSGSAFGGVWKWDGHVWTHVDVGVSEQGNQGGALIHKIRTDAAGTVWLLGLGRHFTGGNQPGAFALRGSRIEHWGVEKGLLDERVYSFAEGTDGSRWFGSVGMLSRWQNGVWTRWNAVKDLHAGVIFTLAVDHENNLWYGDREYQLGRISPNGEITNFGNGGDIGIGGVWDLRVDSSGTVWAGTNKGVFAYARGVWRRFDSRSGMLNSTVWPVFPVANQVLVGTLGDGLIRLSPSESVQPPPRLLLDEPIVQSGSVFLRWNVSSYWNDPPGNQIETRYSINGQAWSAWSLTHDVTIHGLIPGSHFYQVQGRDIYGSSTPPVAPARFMVAPPLMLNPLFLAPISVLGLGLFALSIMYAIRVRGKNRAIRLSETKFRRLTESTFDGILIHDGENVVEANEAIAAMFGLPLNQFVGLPFSALLTPESLRELNYLRTINAVRPLEAAGVRTDGEKIWIEIIENQIPLGAGVARLAAIRNITSRKEAEERLVQHQEKLKGLVMELTNAEQRERRQIATYLHDYQSQALGFCKMKLGTLHGNISEGDLTEVRHYVEELFQKTQSLTFELSPPILYELGLGAALASLSERMAEQHEIRFTFTGESAPNHLEDRMSLFLFYAVRELMLNVVKHSRATACIITLSADAAVVTVEVSDNGIGFDPSQSRTSRTGGGFGIFNIQERLSYLGGTLRFGVPPGGGFSAQITLSRTATRESLPNNSTTREIS